ELQMHEKRLHVTSLLERVASELALEEDILVAEYGPEVAIPPDPVLVDSEAVDESVSDEDPAPVPFDRATQRKRLAEAERKLAQL
ncbi:hypothetical protein ABTL95_20425, partial [Acinetobacter baumannii]